MTTFANMTVEKPELVFGIVAPVGTNLDLFTRVLESELRNRGYSSSLFRLSEYTNTLSLLETPAPAANADEGTRILTQIKRGNEARDRYRRNEILALCAVADISVQRQQRHLPGHAFILRQFKHPEEVSLLRSIYGGGFHLLGVYAPLDERVDYLLNIRAVGDRQRVEEIIDIDEHQKSPSGQHLRDTFHLADVFFRGLNDEPKMKAQIGRFLDLLFGLKVISPTKEEFGMFQAQAAALRSAALSRQVGAALLNRYGDVISVGVNDVPKFGGGLYWEGDDNDSRDHKEPWQRDSNEEMIDKILQEIYPELVPHWNQKREQTKEKFHKEAKNRLEQARIMNLTEFGRAVHAEMEAILSAGRTGISTRGASLFCTTFPCHNCTKHIVAAGIETVYYVEPYPKSLGLELHGDAICLDESVPGRVNFSTFVGVAPRRYFDLFSMKTREGVKIKRKDKSGRLVEGKLNFRLRMALYKPLELEKMAAEDLVEVRRTREEEERNEQ